MEWFSLPAAQAGTHRGVANGPGGREGRNRNVQCELEPAAVFFWQRRGRTVAKFSLSLKTCWRKTEIAVEEERRLEVEISIRLVTVEKNPGPRDKTERGKEERRNRRKERRKEKRERREKEKTEKKIVDIATWNVQRMSVGTYNRRKLRAVADFSSKQDWDTVLLSEVLATGSGTIWLGEGDKQIAVTYTEKAAILLRGNALTSWCQQGQKTKISKRTISVKTMGFSLTSTYLPVWNGRNEEEIEQAKEDLKDHVNWSKKDEILVIGGDFNAHVGRNEDREGVCGIFGIRTTNRQGAELLSWCEDNNLCYVNSYYKHKRRGTWFNNALGRWYELDGFIMRNDQRHNLVRKVHTVLESSLSDHKPKRIKIIPKIKPKSYKRQKNIPRVQWEKLRIEEHALTYRQKVEEKLEQIEREERQRTDGVGWDEIAKVTVEAATETCGVAEKQILNPWMIGRDEEITRMRARITAAVQQRNQLTASIREAGDRDEKERLERERQPIREELKEARKDLKKKSADWEKDWWDEILNDCKNAGERGDQGTVYKHLKQLGTRGITKAPETTNISTEQFKKHFQDISKDRFENSPEDVEEIINLIEDISNTDEAKNYAEILDATPTREEILTQMKFMRESAPGKDGVRLIYLMNGGPELIEKLITMIQEMWEKGQEFWEDSLKVGQVIPLFKKGDRNNVNNFRGVCLLAMGSRVTARIAADRLRIWAETMKLLDDDQAGFRKKRSTADVTQIMVRIQEDSSDLFKRAEKAQENIPDGEKPAARLLDLRKAYPRVNKPALWMILKKYGIGDKFLRVLKDLHESTEYRIKSRTGESEPWIPERGLREGCPSSPPLFNIFHQAVMRLATKARKRKAEETDMDYGLNFKYVPGSSFPCTSLWEKPNSEAKRIKIDKGLFADDTTIVGKKKELQQGVDETKRIMERFEERNNEDKEEHLNFGTEESESIRMLGSWMGEKKDTDQRLKRGGAAWMKVKNRLKGSKMSKRSQAKVVEACVESTILFDCQARTWYVSEIQKLQRMMDKRYRFIWSRKTGPPLIQMQQEGKNMYDVRKDLGVKSLRWKIEKRVLERIGHVMRMENDRTVKAVVLGWMEDLETIEKVPGKKRKTILYWKKILKEAGVDYTKIGMLTHDKKGWKERVNKRMSFLEEWEERKGKKVNGESGERNQRVQIPVVPGEVPGYKCEYEGCGMVCKSRAGLTVHRKRMHERADNKAVFKCQGCGTVFNYDTNLKNHQKSCSGRLAQDPDRRRCGNCDREISSSNFARHRRTCGGQNPPPPGPRPPAARTPCNICGAMVTKSNLARHKRQLHEQ